MRVPSYDDLTPQRGSVVGAPTTLFACLYEGGDDVAMPLGDVRVTPPAVAIAREFSPRIAVAGPRMVIVDVSGLGRLIGAPPVIAAEIDRAARQAGIDVRVAIAPTQTAARLLAIGCPPRMVVTGDVAAALAPLPVTLLCELEALPGGLSPRDRARPFDTLSLWGIATLGDLAALPPAALSSRLGRRGVALQRLARGWDPRPFVPDADTPRYRERLELEWPIDALEPLSFVLARLLDPLSAALERADRGAAAVRLDLRLVDRSTHARVLQLPAAIRDARVLRTLLLLDLESHPPRAAIDVVAIETDPAPARITQFSLLERALPSAETVTTLLARLRALTGEARVGSAGLVDTHEPGAFEMRAFGVTARGAQAADRDAASPPAVTLRRSRPPAAIRVRADGGRPVHVASPRRGQPSGAVIDAAGPWRTSGSWWQRTRWNRDEWDVALPGGAICRIFRDRDTGRWFMDGIYD